MFNFEIQSILEPNDQTGKTHFWPWLLKKNFEQLLIFVNLYHHAKNQFILPAHSSDMVNFRVLLSDWPHPFLTIPTQKNFQMHFNLREFVKACKKSVNCISSLLR